MKYFKFHHIEKKYESSRDSLFSGAFVYWNSSKIHYFVKLEVILWLFISVVKLLQFTIIVKTLGNVQQRSILDNLVFVSITINNCLQNSDCIFRLYFHIVFKVLTCFVSVDCMPMKNLEGGSFGVWRRKCMQIWWIYVKRSW